MRLYVEPMDSTVVEVATDGRVRFLDGEWLTPSFQERRAILYAAENEIEALKELVDTLAPPSSPSASS